MTKKTPWTTEKRDGFIISTAGNTNGLDAVINALSGAPDVKAAQKLLRAIPHHFGIIIENDDFTFAATDKTRSFPVLYKPSSNQITHYAPDLKPSKTDKIDEQGVLQFCMAGYVLGNDTLYEDIKSLQAGECLHLDKKTSKLTLNRYYQYIPKPKPDMDHADAMRLVGDAIDTAIKRTIDYANGRKIWIPLSGGLDSRIIAAKLQEFGYTNMETFSYGVAGNEEAQTAKTVAGLLGLKWTMIPAAPKSAKALYESAIRQNYETQTHDHSTIPSLVEFEAIYALKQTGWTNDDDLIVNGQSGDYICGAHIPSALYEPENPSDRDMMDFIIDKHFSLWENLKTPQNIAQIEAAIEKCLLAPSAELSSKEDIISRYESFEWEERQCKMVVSGHHTYDFFGFDWAMPLWDGDLMDIFETMPLRHKYQRQIFRDYVEDYNHCGVFALPIAVIKTWQPPLSYAIIGTAKIIQLTRGMKAKQGFYKKMSYYGASHNQFALFGKPLYDKHYKNIRNMISLSILDFCNRHNIPFPK